MSSIIQWIIVIALILLIYFGYVHSYIKCMRSNKVHVGMTESQVRRLIGSPCKAGNAGKLKVAVYRFNYANRLSNETRCKVLIEFSNGKVKSIYRSVDNA